MKKIFTLLFCLPILSFSQDDLLDEINTNETDKYVTSAFKGLKIVNFESTKLVAGGDFTLIVSHRFGSIKNGFDNFFGLDNAVTRLNFVYGVSDGFNIGVSRSSFLKIYQTSLKYRLIRQEKGGFPFTIVGFNALLINTALDKNNITNFKFKDRLGYTTQVLISRKVNKNLSVELAPTFFHDGYVSVSTQNNSQFVIGVGGRYKLSKRWSLNADYGLHLNRADKSPFKNPLSIGIDLETGGHVFQMHFTNAQSINTNSFLGQGSSNWSKGEIHFGFNLSRTF